MTITESWTIGRLLEWTTKFLSQKGSESPRLDTEMLLAHALGCKRIDLYTRHDEEAMDEKRTSFRDLIRQRIEGCPVAYLVGRKEFFSLEFEVSRSVLIPGPIANVLSMSACNWRRRCQHRASGHRHRIGQPRRRHCPPAQIGGGDGHRHQLRGAGRRRRNALKHGVSDRVRFLLGDVFTPLASSERFDFVVSNPPYIPHEHVGRLEAGVRDYEPHLALDGGLDGFAVFDRLLAGAPAFLQPGGYLIVEIGSPQGAGGPDTH